MRKTEYYRSLSISSCVLVTCYSDSISGKTSITQDEREVVAADFLIKEGRKLQQEVTATKRDCRLFLDDRGFISSR
jgi:hypothetical protein